jgi:hypothetical protein
MGHIPKMVKKSPALSTEKQFNKTELVGLLIRTGPYTKKIHINSNKCTVISKTIHIQ